MDLIIIGLNGLIILIVRELNLKMQSYGIYFLTHLKVCLATATHSSQWVQNIPTSIWASIWTIQIPMIIEKKWIPIPASNYPVRRKNEVKK